MKNIPTRIGNYKNNKLGIINFLSRHKQIIFIIFAISSYVLLYFLIDFSSQSLVAHDEGLYARRSRLIGESLNWFSSPFVIPHHKTLGSYWLIAISIRLFGNSELALRLPSIITSFLCLVITYLIALKISNKRSAVISIFSLSSMPLWIQYSRYASPDIPFVLCILLVILFFLKFLDSEEEINRYRYLFIFISGLFISMAFFIRSYMALVPIIGLTPFISYHITRSKKIIKLTFFSGILIGSIPTFINLYYAYIKFGIDGITSLFNFARDQAIGEFEYSNLSITFLNYFFLTFPIGILLLILLAFTRSNNNNKYPLLVYFYPISSILLLLGMSTSYSHYYLFLLPSLSILLGIRLESFSFRYSFSKLYIKLIMFAFILLISVALISFLIIYNNLLIDFSYAKVLLIYILSLFTIICFISSLRFLFLRKHSNNSLINFLYNIIIPQYIALSILYNFGVIGSPNLRVKLFLRDNSVASIANSNTIYMYNVESKIMTLLSYYLPSTKILNSPNEISMYNYIITSDLNLFNKVKGNSKFKPIKTFDNHLLLMNISN